ncbi:lipid II:glycine glycyltransferase FemX [Scatolibacter rhodanostii]|uniref:lipid II:glycine glycyltransferase FemX n=1 Tax=Scatolibacter rhodanostii TaxID=2014781 RepID=UPI000C074699|nr:peptidoglycan bridge formation glycyltransferase FemA/FemB family protein [Scatolibacter rhodanostii]
MSRVDFLNPSDWQEYESYVSAHKNACFMQSLQWAAVKPGWEKEAILTRNDDGKIIAAALILIKKVPLLGTSLFYLPHGPVWDFADQSAFSAIMQEITLLAKEYKTYQCLIDPLIFEENKEVVHYLKTCGFHFKPDAKELRTVQPRNNYMLFLEGRSKEEIFASFHSKWRYNIRLAGKKGVECRVCGKEALGDFCCLMKETGRRDGFAVRGRIYFERMLDNLGEHCRLYMCYYNGIALSGAITTQYAGKTCYVYGASSNEYRNLMPNYLMQWEMICWAIENNCDIYDFQGIPFYQDEKHPNYGVYRFKKGFNGKVMTYAGEFHRTYRPILSAAVSLGIQLKWLKAAARRHWLVSTRNKKRNSLEAVPTESTQEQTLLSEHRMQN